MAVPSSEQLSEFLAQHPPFDALSAGARQATAEGARIRTHDRGDVVLDAFHKPSEAVYMVLSGRVELWNTADRLSVAADAVLPPGAIFGFSAMLTGRSMGPRVCAAVSGTTVARFPKAVAAPAFESAAGIAFLAAQASGASRALGELPSYTLVDHLLEQPPLVLTADATVAEAAARMTSAGAGYAAIRRPDGRLGLLTDATVRAHVAGQDARLDVAVESLLNDGAAPQVNLGTSAAEALIQLLDQGTDYILVTDRDGELRGAVATRDFLVSDATAGGSLDEQLRRVASVEQLYQRAATIPALLADLLDRGLTSVRVIAVYSTLIDTLVRRSLALVFQRHDELSIDAFTWLSLGSNGRREAVPSSDIDAAVVFNDAVSAGEILEYQRVFAEVEAVLAGCGIGVDTNGATPTRAPFARTDAQWRAAALRWLADPAKDQGAIMTSLLVDGRPIHGDPGLPEVAKVFGDLRSHPATMRLLLQESLSHRARLGSIRKLLNRRDEPFDMKEHALLPLVNLARWAGLSASSVLLPTTERLAAAAGSPILPREQSLTLIEVFEVLQQIRLRQQLRQLELGEVPTDEIALDRLSAIERSVISRAVREIAAVQKRAANVAAYASTDSWLERGPGP